MKKLKLFPLSIRTQILMMTMGTILLVQSAVFYAGNYLKEKFLEDVVAGHITTTIQIIRSSVAIIPPDLRNEFIKQASRGKWTLWSRHIQSGPRTLPQYRRNQLPQDRPFGEQGFYSNRPPPPPVIQQLFPNLRERPRRPSITQSELMANQDSHDSVEPVLSAPVRKDLLQLIERINQNLDDGTRIGLSERNDIPIMYLSLKPEYNPFNNTYIKEWLVIPLDDLAPTDASVFLLAWIAMTSLLLLAAGYFAWRITTPLMRLTQSADKLAKGVHAKVTPAGPYETKVLGERFNAMLNSLEQAKTVQQTLLAGLPHDLKGPLARMRLRLEMTDDDILREGMSNDVQEMQNIIEQFISYVRGSDPARYNFQLLDLTQWVDDRANAWAQASNDIVLKENAAAPLMVLADTLALGRLLDNLIGNALKHGKPPVEIYLTQTGDFAKLSVCDHGNGIPAERREEALRAFSRLDSARTKTGSVGLGLALVDTIVHAHQGQLALNDSSCGGLKVDILLPLTKGHSS